MYMEFVEVVEFVLLLPRANRSLTSNKIEEKRTCGFD